MKNSEVKELSKKELIAKIQEEKSGYTRLKMNHAVSQLENPIKIRENRKLIARLKTELRSRELKNEQ